MTDFLNIAIVKIFNCWTDVPVTCKSFFRPEWEERPESASAKFWKVLTGLEGPLLNPKAKRSLVRTPGGTEQTYCLKVRLRNLTFVEAFRPSPASGGWHPRGVFLGSRYSFCNWNLIYCIAYRATFLHKFYKWQVSVTISCWAKNFSRACHDPMHANVLLLWIFPLVQHPWWM